MNKSIRHTGLASSRPISTNPSCTYNYLARPSALPLQARLLPCLLLLTSCFTLAQGPAQTLAAHSNEFRKEVIKVTDGIYVAVGYALANCILIEGTTGCLIVDATESPAAAQQVQIAFKRITDRPLKAIIYTHSHPDHLGGASVFASQDKPDIFGHQSWLRYSDPEISPGLTLRGGLQFGLSLPADQYLNAGVGPAIHVDMSGYLPPTKTFSDRLETEIAGVRLVLQHAPGETDDQLYVWLPDKKALLPADNFYKSFPNLYTIRGSRYRDVRQWANSLDKMLAEGEIEYLIPSHTRPVIGSSQVKQALTNYRDAIRYVYQATVEGINAGVPPLELSQQVKLPAQLAADPYLQEYYGTVAWSVRGIYAGLVGWYDGNATSLFPLSTRERAQRIAKLSGGIVKLRKQARKALAVGDAQWVAELADLLLALDPKDEEARGLKADALTILGTQQSSANGRNWYLSQAQQLRTKAGTSR